MARVPSPRKQLRTIRKQLLKAINVDFRSPTQMRFIGNRAIEIIKKRTRNGFGVEADGQAARRLKSLTEPYVNYRRQNRFRLSPFTTPGKSNLTFSGQMIDSMQVRTVSQGRTYIAPFGRRSDSSKTNLQIAGYVSEQGRPFNNLAKSEIATIVKLFRERFPRIARQNRLRVR